jgi:hypothetical protein
VDYTERLSKLLHSTQIPIITITIHTNWNIKVDFSIRIVGLTLPNVPWHSRTSKHDTGERIVKGISSRNNSNSFRASDPDAVVCEELFSFVDTVAELRSPLVDIIKQTNGEVLVDTTGTNIGGMQASS